MQTLENTTFFTLKSCPIRQLQLTYTSTSVALYVNFSCPIRQLVNFKNVLPYTSTFLFQQKLTYTAILQLKLTCTSTLVAVYVNFVVIVGEITNLSCLFWHFC